MSITNDQRILWKCKCKWKKINIMGPLDSSRGCKVWLEGPLLQALEPKPLKGKPRGCWICSWPAKLNLFVDILHDKHYNRLPKRNPWACEGDVEDHLRRTWRKAEEQEKDALKVLWNQIRNRLSALKSEERICKCRSKKEKDRARFLKNSFKYSQYLLEEKKSGEREEPAMCPWKELWHWARTRQ